MGDTMTVKVAPLYKRAAAGVIDAAWIYGGTWVLWRFVYGHSTVSWDPEFFLLAAYWSTIVQTTMYIVTDGQTLGDRCLGIAAIVTTEARRRRRLWYLGRSLLKTSIYVPLWKPGVGPFVFVFHVIASILLQTDPKCRRYRQFVWDAPHFVVVERTAPRAVSGTDLGEPPTGQTGTSCDREEDRGEFRPDENLQLASLKTRFISWFIDLVYTYIGGLFFYGASLLFNPHLSRLGLFVLSLISGASFQAVMLIASDGQTFGQRWVGIKTHVLTPYRQSRRLWYAYRAVLTAAVYVPFWHPTIGPATAAALLGISIVMQRNQRFRERRQFVWDVPYAVVVGGRRVFFQ